MAFKEKSGKTSFQVRHGSTGEILSTFHGSDASKKADDEISRLHAKNDPKQENRGASAKSAHKTREKSDNPRKKAFPDKK